MLPLARSPRTPHDAEVSLDVIAHKRDLLAAINLCIQVSGLEDKEIALALGIDAGHFSNIRNGKAGCNFPTNKLDDLMTLCGNEIPLIWQALKRGKVLVMLESEAQRQLRVANELLVEERKRSALLADLLQGKAAL